MDKKVKEIFFFDLESFGPFSVYSLTVLCVLMISLDCFDE